MSECRVDMASSTDITTFTRMREAWFVCSVVFVPRNPSGERLSMADAVSEAGLKEHSASEEQPSP